jgi:TP901 family phage tail tape measure protein
MADKTDYIINLVLNDKLSAQINQTANTTENGVNRIITSTNKLNKVIVGPTGQPAAQQIAYSTPSVLRTAEERMIVQQRASQPSGITPAFSMSTGIGDVRSSQYALQEAIQARQALQEYKAQISRQLTGPQERLQLPYYPQQIPLQNQSSGSPIMQGGETVKLLTDQRNAMRPDVMKTAWGNMDLNEKLSDPKISTPLTPGFGSVDTKEQLGAIRELNQLYKTTGMSVKEYNEALFKITGTTKGFKEETGFAGLNLGKLAIRAAATIPIWLALRAAVMGFLSGISANLKLIMEYESALAEIQIASNATKKEVADLGSAVMYLASTYGIVGTEALKAAKLFAQQGLSLKETYQMTKAATVASQLLGEDVTKIAEGLTSAVRAYGLEVGDSLSVVDKWMKVQKEYAVTAKDLEEGMKTAGATAATFGISLDDLNGQLVGIIETTRKTGSQTGNALVMMYTRLFTTAKDYIQTIAKVPVYEDANGQATMKNTNKYRDAVVVISDIAKAWDKLDASQKLNLATQIGSRRNATAFSALMNNYNRVLKATADSQNAAGTALESLATKQDTTKYKADQLAASWSNFILVFQDTSVYKGTLDALNNIVKSMTSIASVTDGAKMAIREFYEEQTKLENKKAKPDKAKLEENDFYQLHPELAPDYQKKIKEARIQKAIGLGAFLGPVGQATGVGLATVANLFDKPMSEKDRTKKINEIKVEDVEKSKVAKQTKEDELAIQAKIDKTAAQEINLINYKANLLEQQGKSEADILKFKIEQYEEAQVLSADSKYQLEIDKMRYDWLLKTTELKKKKIDTNIEHEANILSLMGKDELQILQYKKQQSDAAYKVLGIAKTNLEITAEQNALEEARLKLIYEQSNALKDSMKGSIEDMLAGTATIKDFFTNFNETVQSGFRSKMAEGMSERIMQSGIGETFGEMGVNLKSFFDGSKSKGLAGSVQSGIENGFQTGTKKVEVTIVDSFTEGSNRVYDKIVQGFADGAAGTSTLDPTRGAGSKDAISNVAGGLLKNILGGQPTTGSDATEILSAGANIGMSSGAKQPGMLEKMGTSLFGSGGKGSNILGIGKGGISGGGASGGTFGQNMGSAAGGVMAVAGFGMGLAQSYKLKGTGNVVGGAMNLGMSGAMAGMAVGGPIGAIIGGAVGVAVGAIQGGKSKTTEEWATSTNQITAKLDVSNKQLEYVNRNLVALRSEFKTFMLPKSAYFTTKNSIEDEFSISSRRGII